MDAYLTIISLRAVHEYSSEAVPDESLKRILQAGRSTGSSQNRQPWKFYVLRDAARRAQLGETLYSPDNVVRSNVCVALTTSGKSNFDIGRVSQNMMLAAWNDGIGSSPNGIREQERARGVLSVIPEETIVTVLSFGYPAHPRRPSLADAEGILRRMSRKPFEDIVVDLG